MSFSGGCRCGATRYQLAVETLTAIYCCHCTDCQRWSGSAFSEPYGFRIEAPVVARLSRSIWAFAASFSA